MTQGVREQLQATLGTAYTIERELGGGGMSRVFVAEEMAFGRKVVVKVLPPELTAGVNVERFNREILVAARLQHPHIVPVLAAGETDGLPYYTMPYVEGDSLRARLAQSNALSITDAVGVLRDVAKALAFAHERGVVHRDIKPDNVLLTGGSATVTDFGIAKAIRASRAEGANATLTQVGTSIGTPAYMSPEQASGDPATDHRTDLYSFGCLAYEVLAGRPPFADRTPRKLLAAHMGEAPAPVSDLRADTPAALAELVMRCLAKDPDDRPQHASELVHVLETTTSGGTQPAMPPVLLGGPAMFRKALLLYAGAFVAVAILAKAAIVGIGLPDWVFPGALIVMALGLPVILWTGYVQRVTRHAMTMTPTFTPGGSPSVAHGPIATMALKAAPRMSWVRTARGGMYALGAFVVLIAGFMLLRSLGIGPAGSLLASGKLTQKEPLLITDFRVTGADSSLGRVVSDAVRTGLGQSSVISLVSPAGVAAALRRMERPGDARVTPQLAHELAARDGIKAIVDGDVTGVGAGYIVVLRLVTADSSTELWSARETGDGPRGLIDATDRLVRELRAKAGESLRAVQAAEPLAQVTSGSLEALRKYSEGVRFHDVMSDWPNAIARFREAVVIDTNFAMAWRKLGAALGNAGRSHAEVNAALEQAHRHRDHLTQNERDFEEAYYFLRGPGGDRAKGIALYESVMQRGDLSPATNLALELLTRREFARAESLYALSRRAFPGQGLAWYELAWAQADQGHWKDAAASLAQAKQRFPGNGLSLVTEAHLLYHAGQIDSLQRLLDDAREHGRADNRPWATGRSADLAFLRGRVGVARKLYAEESEGAAKALGAPQVPVSDSAAVTRMEVATWGASPRGAQRIDAALTRSPLRALAAEDRPYFSVATAFARAGRPDRARAILAEYERDVRDTALKRGREHSLHNAQGEIALAENRPADALREFRRADVAPDGPSHECPICLPINLARAFDAAHQRDSAIVMYERYQTTPYMERIDRELFEDSAEPLDPTFLPGVHRRLGALYEDAGDPVKAAEHYRAFIELWKNADPELQPRVAEARRRLAKLTPVEPPRR